MAMVPRIAIRWAGKTEPLACLFVLTAGALSAQGMKNASAEAQRANKHYAQGWSAVRAEGWDDAVREFQEAINNDPKFALAYYSLGRAGVVYLTGEYRRGDTVSTGHPSLVNVGLAEVFAPDDAFDGADLVAYRFEARTLLGTVGYNYPLGGRDSLDFSLRRVQATPLARPSFDFSGSMRYIENQYSIVYLMRF